MSAYNRNMPHDATYWPAGANDGFGGVTYGTPVALKVRWQDSNELFKDATGQEFMANAVIYTAHGVELKGMFAKGTHTTIPDRAKEVKVVYTTSNLDGTITLTKAVL